MPAFQEAVAQHSASQWVVKDLPREDPLCLVPKAVFALRNSPERTMLALFPVLSVHKLLLLLLVVILKEILDKQLLKG